MTGFCLAPAACDRGGGSDDPGAASGRVNRRVKCESPYKYDGRTVEGSANYGKFGASGQTSVEQVREVDKAVERYTARYMSLCNDYRNGAISPEQYADESAELRRGMQRLEELMMQLDAAASPEEFRTTLDALRSAATLSASKGDLSLEVTVWSRVPGGSEFRRSPQGATLASGSQLYFDVSVTRDAHLYLYQVNAKGELAVLFPDPQIPFGNPLRAGATVRIPHGAYTYDVNAEDLGLENLHVVASARPLDQLESTARQDQGAGQVADNDLACGTRGLELSAPPTCVNTRGLQLSSGQGAPPPEQVRVQSQGSDDAIHVVYGFHHVIDHERFGRKVETVIEPEGASGGTRPGDFERCPTGTALKQMPLPDGALERWCVGERDGGVVVDHGPYRRWHPNGALAVTGELRWGERTGAWAAYGPDNSPLANTTY